MIASYLLDSTRSAHPLEELALEHTGYKALREEDVCGRGVKALSFAALPIAGALDFAGERADLALQLSGTLRRSAGQGSARRRSTTRSSIRSSRCWSRSSAPASGSTSRRCARRPRWSTQELDRLASRVYELSGEEFNINSPKKLSEVLFDKLGLRTETHPAHHQDQGAVDLVRGARGARADPRAAAADSRMARPAEAEGHLHRRAAAAGAPGDRPRPHLLQPGRRGDRSPEQQRPQPAEHPDPHRGRPQHPPRLRRRARPRADLRRLLADRAARAGAPLRRAGADRRVRARRGHSRSHRGERCSAGSAASAPTSCAAAPRSSTTRCSTASRRSRWRRTSACRARRRRTSSTPTSPGSPRSARSSTARSRKRAQTGVVKTMFGRRRLVPDLTAATARCAARRARRRSTCRSRAPPPTCSSAR